MARRRVRPPPAQARASNSRLTRSSWRTWPHREAAQEGAQGGWRLDHTAESAGCPAGAQRIGVVDAVAARQCRCHQRHHLVAGVGSAWGPAQVQAPVNQLGQAQVQGQGGRKDQPGIVATRRWSSKAIRMRSGWWRGGIYWVLLFLGPVLCFKTIIPDSEEHPLATSGR